jgi:hypothetical protein
MESPNPIIDTPGAGVAMIPMSADRMRSLISDSQGARPPSNVYSFSSSSRPRRTTHMTATGHMTLPLHPPIPQRISRVRAVEAFRGAEAEDRKRPAEDDPVEHSLLSTDDDMPGLTPRHGFDSSDESSDTLPSVSVSASVILAGSGSAALHSSSPATRSRKRRAENPLFNARRPAVASADGRPAGNLKSDPEDDLSDAGSCCICMCDPDDGERSTIDGCDHEFCFDCIEKWSERENTCPLCKVRFNRINREGSKKKGQKGTKKVKQRDQRADLNPGNALEGLLGKLRMSMKRK